MTNNPEDYKLGIYTICAYFRSYPNERVSFYIPATSKLNAKMEFIYQKYPQSVDGSFYNGNDIIKFEIWDPTT